MLFRTSSGIETYRSGKHCHCLQYRWSLECGYRSGARKLRCYARPLWAVLSPPRVRTYVSGSTRGAFEQSPREMCLDERLTSGGRIVAPSTVHDLALGDFRLRRMPLCLCLHERQERREVGGVSSAPLVLFCPDGGKRRRRLDKQFVFVN